MAMALSCGGCGEECSFLFAAQFSNGPSEITIICPDCWDSGYRCFSGSDGLKVAKECPAGYLEASLYWDEGGYVTGGHIPFCYPDVYQPSISKELYKE